MATKEKDPTPAITPASPAPENQVRQTVRAGEAAGVGNAPLIYVGPSIATPVLLNSRAIFAGGLPRHIREYVDGDPDLQALFVPLVSAGAALRGLESGQGELAKAYQRVRRHGGRKA